LVDHSQNKKKSSEVLVPTWL